MKPERERLAKRLSEFRAKRALSVSQMAMKAGVPVATYREWERGRGIKSEYLHPLARALDVSIEDLLGLGDLESLSEAFVRLQRALQLLKERVEQDLT